MKLTPGCTERKRRIIAVNGAVTAYQSDIMKSQLRNVTFSTEYPKTTDGIPGDMWVVYGDE